MTKEVHQQTGNPGPRATGIVLHTGFMPNACPARIHWVKRYQCHRHVNTQGNKGNNGTLTGALGSQTTKSLLFIGQFP